MLTGRGRVPRYIPVQHKPSALSGRSAPFRTLPLTGDFSFPVFAAELPWTSKPTACWPGVFLGKTMVASVNAAAVTQSAESDSNLLFTAVGEG
jgi:hypothetical protein